MNTTHSVCVASMLHGGVRLRHSGFRSRKRRNARHHPSFIHNHLLAEEASVLWVHLTVWPRANESTATILQGNRMRANTTSGIPRVVCVSVCALLVLLSVSGTAYAKRGCSAFGHSCFGGHGKRFDPQLREDVFQENQATTSDRNQELDVMRLNSRFGFPEQKFEGQGEVLPSQTRRQGSSRFDPYTLSFIFGQWLSSHRRLRQPDAELNNK